MNKVSKRRVLGFFGITLLCTAGSVNAQQAPISCKGRLSEEQVTQLLKAGVADVRVQVFVNKCGVDFAFTQEVETRLRTAGASDSLIKLAQARAASNQEIRQPVRREELHRKLSLDASLVPALKPNLTLDEARQRLAILRRQTSDIENQLRTEYSELEMRPTITKDKFESTAEYQARQDRANAEQKEMEDHYRTDLASLTADYNKQIDELLSRKYAKAAFKLNSIDYDADRRQLIVTVGDVHYRFAVEPAKARVWYEHQGTLELKGNFLKAEDNGRESADEITLLDPQTREELSGQQPLSRDDVFILLKGKVSPARVAQMANEWGINFQVSHGFATELRQAGADDDLINTLVELRAK